MRKISYVGWGLFLFALILSGCGKLERGGTPPVNMPPQVFFTNIPAEGDSFSISPQIYWYGTDEDGFIIAYQYAVIRDSVVKLWGGLEFAKDSLRGIEADSASWVDNTTARLNIFAAHVAAEQGQQRNVRLYAAEIETVYTPQYVFLRAVDNKGGISEIKTRMYWRNNHAPQCSVDVDESFVSRNFYSLPEITSTWRGIEIPWVGLDTLDYPDKRKQPDFYFMWELWGPYADTLNLGGLNAPVDSSLDSIEIGGVQIYDRWVLNESQIFKNLKNYSENGSDYGYGWYQLKVWSRDDAFVSSKKPATTFFRILKPLFRYEEPSRKTILVLDHTRYGADGGVASPADVLPFYQTALLQIADLWDNYNIYSLGENQPKEDSLSRYDLVIVVNAGKPGGISDSSYLKYKNYMDVGGRLWVIGLDNYKLAAGTRSEHYLDERRGAAPNTYEVGTAYLGLEGIYYPQYTPGDINTLEFIGATPFGSWQLPSLDMDPVKAAKLRGYDPKIEAKDFPKYGIPHVSYDIIRTILDSDGRAPLYRRVYSFVSRRGLSSEMNQMPCATTFIGPTYRTAEFSFPLSLMKDGNEAKPGALEAFRMMVKWFWE
jgi:hypothetical protein